MRLNGLSLVTLLVVTGFLSGCTSKGFSRAALEEQAGTKVAKFDDQDIKAAFQKKPNLPKPFRMAVYFKEFSARKATPSWRWSESDRALLEPLMADLKARGLLADFFPLNSATVETEDLKSLRLAAAKHQADALLIIGGGTQIERTLNPWGWSYALLAPVFFVPGSKAETVFLSNASMWDVKNEYLYATAESEATTSQKYVAAFGPSDKELIDEAKTQSLKKLSIELQNVLKGQKF